MNIVIDGNDGTGKTTIVNRLREIGYNIQDRGLPTKMTDNMELISLLQDDDIFLIFDNSVETSRKRLEKAGRNLDEKYHTVEDLTYYRDMFLKIYETIPNAFYIDSERTEEEVFKNVLEIISSLKVKKENNEKR